FLTLGSDLSAEFGTIPVRSIREEEIRDMIDASVPVIQAGYGGEESKSLSAHFNCSIVDVSDSEINLVIHQCDSLWGDSGSPLLLFDRDRYSVLAVDSRFNSYEGESKILNLAVDSRAFYETYVSLGGLPASPSAEQADSMRPAVLDNLTDGDRVSPP
ncbi:MAG: hypothetical protein AAFX40_13185, partial [Cyanobacteria bacterium J06639_1]